MSYLEINADAEKEFPGISQARAEVEAALVKFLAIANPEIDGVDWMPSAWAAGIEAIGYNREGRKYRAFDCLVPNGQSVSATSGVLDLAKDGYMSAVYDCTLEDDD